jgi:hypothetical protein
MSKQNKFSNNHNVSKSELGGCKLFEMRFERCHSEANTVRSNVDAPIQSVGRVALENSNSLLDLTIANGQIAAKLFITIF